MLKKIRPVWAEIDLDNLAHNMKEIRRVSQSKEIMAVVKADAYGHGAVDVAPVLLENGATSLGVALITEAIELREAGIEVPILVLGYTPPEFYQEIVEYHIQQTIFSVEDARRLSEEAQKQKTVAQIHIAIDTGMGRIGFLLTDEGIENIKKINQLDNLEIVGVFSHFSTSDERDKSYTNEQLRKYRSFTERLTAEGINLGTHHIANSAAIIDLPETHFDAIRPGIILYGYYPSEEVDKSKINLKPVLTLKTKVAHLKKLPKDMYISYGRTFKTERDSIIATLPIGYADGYTRLLNHKAKAIVRGKLVPVVGSICMDQCMIDVTDVGELKEHEEVILLGAQGEASFDAEDIAKLLGTISYEITCMIGKRVPRVYIKDGKVVSIRNYI